MVQLMTARIATALPAASSNVRILGLEKSRDQVMSAHGHDILYAVEIKTVQGLLAMKPYRCDSPPKNNLNLGLVERRRLKNTLTGSVVDPFG